MNFVYNYMLRNYNVYWLVAITVCVSALNAWSLVYSNPKKEDAKEPLWFKLFYYAAHAAFLVAGFVLKDKLNSVLVGIVMGHFFKLALCDLLTGEIYLGNIVNFIGLTVINSVWYNTFFGCGCISKWVAVAASALFALVIANEMFNSESSIGGADIYAMGTLIALNFAYFMVMKEQGVDPLVNAQYWIAITTAVFANFFLYFVLYVTIAKLLKKSCRGIRCLPIFYLPLFVTVLALFQL